MKLGADPLAVGKDAPAPMVAATGAPAVLDVEPDPESAEEELVPDEVDDPEDDDVEPEAEPVVEVVEPGEEVVEPEEEVVEPEVAVVEPEEPDEDDVEDCVGALKLVPPPPPEEHAANMTEQIARAQVEPRFRISSSLIGRRPPQPIQSGSEPISGLRDHLGKILSS